MTSHRLGIPGEDLAGSHAGSDFVAWYNGHPDHADDVPDLSTERAVVVGNGNVALDVARMLALTPGELAVTDVADHALGAFTESRIREIVVLGRRGPAQAAYGMVELRELGQLADASVVVAPEDVELDDAGRAALEAEGPAAQRKLELLREYSRSDAEPGRRRIVLRFLTSPVEILGDDRVRGVRVARNEMVEDCGGALAAHPTGETEVIEAGLVMRCVGYRGTGIPGVPFDDRRGVVHNDGGRVLDGSSGQPVPGVYACGWIKRGPRGVIGTNKKCALETVGALLEDVAAGRMRQPSGDPDALPAELARRGVRVVDYAGWEAVDRHERAGGDAAGRPRVKLTQRAELLEHAGAG
jgi:ferredoxin--NADP+ reductase